MCFMCMCDLSTNFGNLESQYCNRDTTWIGDNDVFDRHDWSEGRERRQNHMTILNSDVSFNSPVRVLVGAVLFCSDKNPGQYPRSQLQLPICTSQSKLRIVTRDPTTFTICRPVPLPAREIEGLALTNKKRASRN